MLRSYGFSLSRTIRRPEVGYYESAQRGPQRTTGPAADRTVGHLPDRQTLDPHRLDWPAFGRAGHISHLAQYLLQRGGLIYQLAPYL